MPSSESTEVADDAFYEALLDDDVEDLYEHAPCGYLSTTPDGRIVKANATFLTWTGHAGADVLGRRLADLLTAGGRIYYETHLAPMLQMQDRVREIAVEVVCADGSRLPVLLNAVLRRDGQGTPTAVRIAAFDATERRAYEHELLAARRRAESSETRARVLAETLQATFIPPETPEVPGLDVGAVYRPAGAGDEVGGDFYDVFELHSGEWAVLLGDVCGKGAEAAVVTSLARYISRGTAMRSPSPASVLSTLNEAIIRQGSDRFCTAVYARVVPEPGGAVVTMALGGHLQPILVPADGPASWIGAPGTLLGVLDDVRLPETTVVLGPGDALVLLTDGVTEARSPTGEFFGEEATLGLVGSARGSARDRAELVASAVLDHQHGNAKDDIAVVVLAAPPA